MTEISETAQTFDRGAGGYDAARRQLIPCFDAFYGTALELLEEPRLPPGGRRVLELGAGTGLLSAMILHRFPEVVLTAMDASPGMLAQARARLAGEAPRVELVEADFAGHALGGPYHAVVSALAIHHLPHRDKRALFSRVHASLHPDGCFVNADQLRAPTAAMERRYLQTWLRQVRAAGVAEDALAAARERMRHDITATVPDQLEWLRAAGFDEVDCVFKSWMFGVFLARRRDSAPG